MFVIGSKGILKHKKTTVNKKAVLNQLNTIDRNIKKLNNSPVGQIKKLYSKYAKELLQNKKKQIERYENEEINNTFLGIVKRKLDSRLKNIRKIITGLTQKKFKSLYSKYKGQYTAKEMETKWNELFKKHSSLYYFKSKNADLQKNTRTLSSLIKQVYGDDIYDLIEIDDLLQGENLTTIADYWTNVDNLYGYIKKFYKLKSKKMKEELIKEVIQKALDFIVLKRG